MNQTDMQPIDVQQAREARRRQCVAAVVGGMSQAEAARQFGVHPDTVLRWMILYRTGADVALRAKPLGPRKKKPLPPLSKNDPRFHHWKDEDEKRRKQCVTAILGGMSQEEAAHQFGVAPSIVSRWMAKVRIGGPAALATRTPGLSKPLPPLDGEEISLLEGLGEEKSRWLCTRAVKNGLTIPQTGFAFGIARATIHEWVDGLPDAQTPLMAFSGEDRLRLRQRCVLAVREGLTQPIAAQAFGVSRTTVALWLHKVRAEGWAALEAKTPQRPSQKKLPRSKKKDARRLSARQKEKLRKQCVALVEGGMPMAAAARKLGIHSSSAFAWMKDYREGGEAALKAKPLGRKTKPETLEKTAARLRRKEKWTQVRLACVAAVQNGASHKEAARRFGVDRGSVRKWVRQARESGG